jgi:hypothetical protein
VAAGWGLAHLLRAPRLEESTRTRMAGGHHIAVVAEAGGGLLSFLLLCSVRLFTSTTAPHAACIIVFKPTDTLTECCHVCTLDVAKASRAPVAWRVWEIPPEESAGTSSLGVGRTAHTLLAPTHRAHRPARRRRRSSRRWETRSWSCCFPSIHPLS